MRELSDMSWVELRKVVRSGMPIWTLLFALFLPLAIAFLIFVARSPDVAQKLGLVSAKANLMAYSATDWPAFLKLLGEIIAGGSSFLFVLIVSWVFGREFVDGTVKDLLAVPVGRSSILLAKFLVSAAWSAVLVVAMAVAGVAMGLLIGLPGGSIVVVLGRVAAIALMGCMTIVVVLPFAILASAGRGYLLPVGVAVLMAILTNFVAILGLGAYFPWAVPGLYAQASPSLVPASYWIVVLTGLAGMVGTYLWWKLADQNR